MNLNHDRLVSFADWATAPLPRPLPRTVVPVPGEYHLGYIRRLAEANHLEFLELTAAIDPPSAIVFDPRRYAQHQQERLASASNQPLARITRLYWPDPRHYLRDLEGFHRMLRPACYRCTARRGIREPVACHLPAQQTVCQRHRLWTGPSARTHADQLDVSQIPEILHTQRHHGHLAQHHHLWHLGDAIHDATQTIYRALRAGEWTPQQRQRMRQLSPDTWRKTTSDTNPGWQHNGPTSSFIEIAIYPDVIRLATLSLQAHNSSHQPAVQQS